MNGERPKAFQHPGSLCRTVGGQNREILQPHQHRYPTAPLELLPGLFSVKPLFSVVTRLENFQEMRGSCF
jgi:hypothetical protein